MDYKEKYNKLVEAVKVLQETNPSDEGIQNWVNDNVPELSKSEDEKVREDIIHLVNAHGQGRFRESMLAWLENIPYTIDRKKREGFHLGYKAGLEKQGEQKPADKVEPKFKIGDWIAYNHNPNLPPRKIIQITNEHYVFNNGSFEIKTLEADCHLWTIQDAKPGDVIAEDPIERHPSSFVAIYKKQNEEDFDSYCFVGFDGKFYEGEYGHSSEDIHPATKEQRDLLFQKIHEAGYTWNVEKKELMEIEEELTDFEKSLKHIMIETLECGDIRNLKADAEMLLRLAQKSTEWSEEDERAFHHVLSVLEDYGEEHPSKSKFVCNWLKSIKARMGGDKV